MVERGARAGALVVVRDALANAVKDFMAAVELPGTLAAVNAGADLGALADFAA